MSSNYRVLVADDHAVVRSGITYLINQQSLFEVVDQTTNWADTYMRVEQGDIDVLILDLSMPPGESGMVTAQRIHEKYPAVKIIILSMHEEQEYINQALHNGALAYVLKSSPDVEIIRALQQVINGHQYVDQKITLTKDDLKQIAAGGNLTDDLPAYASLSKREKEVFPFVALGYSNKEIAARLFISTKTVEAHKANIARKLKLSSRAELVRYAVHHHLIDI